MTNKTSRTLKPSQASAEGSSRRADGTIIYLAWNAPAHRTLAKHAAEGPVDILISYFYLKGFRRVMADYNIGRLALDSGAFSAWRSKQSIDLDAYIDVCHEFSTAADIFGLDVIGDAAATRRNIEYMWTKGVKAIPTFHRGSSWDELAWATRNAHKVALGRGTRPTSKIVPWLKQVFARCWPKKVHGFAMTSDEQLRAVPFDSVDATSWYLGPDATGRWMGFNGKGAYIGARLRGEKKDYWLEVEALRKRSRLTAAIWRKAFEQVRP